MGGAVLFDGVLISKTLGWLDVYRMLRRLQELSIADKRATILDWHFGGFITNWERYHTVKCARDLRS